MTRPDIHPADALRDASSALEPDQRTVMAAAPDAPSLASHHAEIAAIRLSTSIPEPIAIQFEVARNLYLYAWYVYRFYMTASAQALATLEFGLRERLRSSLLEQNPKSSPRLRNLLHHAIDIGLVKNEGFRRWHRAAELNAQERVSMDVLKALIDGQLASVETSTHKNVEITPEEQSWDLVSHLRNSLPKMRNELAHGSPMLTNQVWGTLELVAEILNQLYPAPATAKAADTCVTT
jgi:hypothetical protein